MPGKLIAHNCGLFYINDWLLWSVVAYDFRQLGFSGTVEARKLGTLPSSKPEAQTREMNEHQPTVGVLERSGSYKDQVPTMVRSLL